MLLRLPIVLTGVLMASTAAAQFNTCGGFNNRNVSNDDLSITISGETEIFLSIDDCRSKLNDDYSIQGTLGNGVPLCDGELTIFVGRDGVTCNESVLSSCPATTADGTCQCLVTSDAGTSLSTTEDLVDIWPEACDTEGRFELDFEVRFIEDLGTEDQEATSDPSKVIVDLEPPATPDEAPTIQPSDGALVVTFPERRGTETFSYEACYRILGSADEDGIGLPDAGGDRFPSVLDAEVLSSVGGNGAANLPTNDTLRGSFNCNCDKKEDTEYRCEGLENGVDYEVVYAVLDEAGNRSESSPSSLGTPGQVLDFAERYNGGETGGCHAVGGSGVGFLALLAGLGLMMTTRRRRQ
ncbi:MAG: MYXO-CTERM sorting domain-containing protein [Bradymonadia bacterium]